MMSNDDLIYKMSQDILDSPLTSEEAKREARVYIHTENMKAIREIISCGIDLSFTMTPMEREAFEIESLRHYREGK